MLPFHTLASTAAVSPQGAVIVATGCQSATASRTAGKPGNSNRTSTPARRSAAGNAPATSARPPVFSSG